MCAALPDIVVPLTTALTMRPPHGPFPSRLVTCTESTDFRLYAAASAAARTRSFSPRYGSPEAAVSYGSLRPIRYGSPPATVAPPLDAAYCANTGRPW